MPRLPTGSRRWVGGLAEVRLAFAGKKETIKLPHCRDDDSAAARQEILAAVAKLFRDSGKEDAVSLALLRQLGRLQDGEQLIAGVRVSQAHASGQTVRAEVGASRTPTFREVCERWTSGDLAERWPDHVKAIDHQENEKRSRYLYGVELGPHRFGDVPVDEIDLDVADQVMARLPATARSPSTRRHYGQIIAKVMAMAAYPLRLIPSSPIPRQWLPKVGQRPGYPFLYPDEDAQLLGCAKVPLEWRLLWGFLAREGCRVSEAGRLAWHDFDLRRGILSLDRNKTKDPRSWVLDNGVVTTLADEKKRRRPDEADPVFPNLPNKHQHHADVFRAHLLVAGVDRRELHQPGANTRSVRAHDLRATFITLALANGRSEAWVMARTGHRSSSMLNKYRRPAMLASEATLGELQPMASVLRVPTRKGPRRRS